MKGLRPFAPTKRLLLLAACGPALSVGTLLFNLNLWFVSVGYTIGLITFALYDGRTGFRPRHLELVADPPNALYMGETGLLPLHLSSHGQGAFAAIEIVCDVDDKVAEAGSRQIVLDQNGEASLPFDLNPVRRGEARIDAVWCRWVGPFGLTVRTKKFDVEIVLVVLPNLPAVRRAALRLDRRGARAGQKPQLVMGAGSEFEALREYVTGMDRRGIDWKHSGRHRKLITKEYRTEQNHSVVLAIDCGHVMREPIEAMPKVDHAINAALIVCYQALTDGDRIGVFGFDAEPQAYCLPQSGQHAFPQVQRTLAALEYSLREPNFTLNMTRLMQELREPSIVIVISDFLDTVSAELMVESLTHLARRHLVLFAALSDPALANEASREPRSRQELVRAVVAEDLVRERQAVLERLRRARIDAFDVPPRLLDANLLSRFAAIKEKATFMRVM